MPVISSMEIVRWLVIGAGCGLVDRADVCALVVEGGIGLRGQPVADAMRLEVGLFFKKRPTERCEMFGMSPRRMASSAISRWLQWLIGRSLSDGFSHVIATTAQICSGVNVAGAPERGASASRSGTDCLSAASRHRLRQYRTVLGQTPSSRALARTPDRLGRVHDNAGAQRQLLRCRMGANQIVPALRAARAKRSPARRPVAAWQPPVPAPDSSCHITADSTPQISSRPSGVKTSARLY